jgi:Fe-S-cluster containining protein
VPEFDCQTCGACCVAERDDPTYPYVSPADVRRSPPRFVRLHVINEHIATTPARQRVGPLRGTTACTCAALRGSVGHRVSCSIYEHRPDVCRAFEPGSSACLAARSILDPQ